MTAFTRLWAAPDVRRSFPAYVVVPQTRDRSANTLMTRMACAFQPGAPLADVLALVDELMRRHPIDPPASMRWAFRWARPPRWTPPWPARPVRRDGRAVGRAARAQPGACRGACADLADPRRLRSGECLCRRPGLGRNWPPPAVGPGSSPYVGMDHRVPPQLFTDGAWRQWLFEQRRASAPLWTRPAMGQYGISSAPVIQDSHVAHSCRCWSVSSPMHGEGNGPAVPRPDVASAGGAPGRAAQA